MTIPVDGAVPSGTRAGTPQVLLGHHLKQLKLPTILREYDKVARECAQVGVDHPGYLLRGRILDEVVAITGHHRKHAARMLRGGTPKGRKAPRPGRRTYGDAVRQALVLAWEAADRICGKRLKALLPVLLDAMDRHGHLAIDAPIRQSLLWMSAATIDRALIETRVAAGRGRRRSGPSSAVKRAVAIRTFADWNDPAPGFVEADLMVHSGPVARGSFLQTLVLTDTATGWTECAPLLVREQVLLTRVLDEVRKAMPFALLGLDTDNDSVFMNETVRAARGLDSKLGWARACKHRLSSGRCRQAHPAIVSEFKMQALRSIGVDGDCANEG